jgi:hypothetical protein
MYKLVIKTDNKGEELETLGYYITNNLAMLLINTWKDNHQKIVEYGEMYPDDTVDIEAIEL